MSQTYYYKLNKTLETPVQLTGQWTQHDYLHINYYWAINDHYEYKIDRDNFGADTPSYNERYYSNESYDLGSNYHSSGYTTYNKLRLTKCLDGKYTYVCYGNGIYIALQPGTSFSNTKIAYSYDTITWNTVDLIGESPNFYHLAYGDGFFVTINSSSNEYAYSRDGITWSKSALPNANYNSSNVIYCNGYFFVIRDDESTITKLYVTTAGAVSGGYKYITYQLSNSSLGYSQSWKSIVYLNGVYIAIGKDNQSYYTKYAYSTDGDTWVVYDLNLKYNELKVITLNNKFYLLGSTTRVSAYSSTDGISWEEEFWIVSQFDFMAYSQTGNPWILGVDNMASDGAITYSCSIDGTASSTNSGRARYEEPTNSIYYVSDLCYSPKCYLIIINKIIYRIDKPLEYKFSGFFDKNHFTSTTGTLPSSKNWSKIITNGSSYFISECGCSQANWVYKSSATATSWTSGTFPNTSVIWNDVCYGRVLLSMINIQYVAISDQYYATSVNGTSWTQGTFPSIQSRTSICYGNGRFITVSPNYATISLTGNKWVDIKLPIEITDPNIIFGDGIFLITGGAKSLYSTDGYTWNSASLPLSRELICYGNGRFLIIPQINSTIAYSYNGIDWSTLSVPIFKSVYKRTICYGDPGFLVCGDDDVFFSSDGFNWVSIPVAISSNSDTSGLTTGCAYINGKYIVIKCISTAYYTIEIDQSNLTGSGYITEDLNVHGYWNRVTTLCELKYSWNITFSGFDVPATSTYVSGDTVTIDNTYQSGEYGVTFTTSSFPADYINGCVDCCYGNGKYIIVFRYEDSSNAYFGVYYSTNGTSWSKYNIVNNATSSNVPSPSQICYGSSKFIILCTGCIYYSTNGTSWSKYTPATNHTDSAGVICYGNSKFVILWKNTNQFSYSTNGTSWSTTNLGIPAPWESVIYGGSLFVVISSIGNFAYSSDGINWTCDIMPTYVDSDNVYIHKYNQICYGNGVYIVSSSSFYNKSYPQHYLYGYEVDDIESTSITWVEYEAPWGSNGIAKMTYDGGIFIVSLWYGGGYDNGGKVYYSTNGINWKYELISSKFIWNIYNRFMYNAGVFYVPAGYVNSNADDYNSSNCMVKLTLYTFNGWVQKSTGGSASDIEGVSEITITTTTGIYGTWTQVTS